MLETTHTADEETLQYIGDLEQENNRLKRERVDLVTYAEVERWKAATADLGRCFSTASQRIAELERLLAEQTVRNVQIPTHTMEQEFARRYDWGFAAGSHLGRRKGQW